MDGASHLTELSTSLPFARPLTLLMKAPIYYSYISMGYMDGTRSSSDLDLVGVLDVVSPLLDLQISAKVELIRSTLDLVKHQ